MLVKLVGKELLPEEGVTPGTQPGFEPIGGTDPIEVRPAAKAEAAGGMQQVADAGEQGQAPEAQHRAGAAPGIEPPIQEEPHGGVAPAHLICQAQLLKQLKKCPIAKAMEVVVALKRLPGERKAGGHATKAIIRFKQHRLGALNGQLVGHRQTHRAATHHRNCWCHQKGITTWE